MHFEVEQKFALDSVAEVEQRLAHWGAGSGVSEQSDLYFNHPARDFAKTDEALRLRSVGDEHFITYKGPKLDATTKTRQEIELPPPCRRGAWRPSLGDCWSAWVPAGGERVQNPAALCSGVARENGRSCAGPGAGIGTALRIGVNGHAGGDGGRKICHRYAGYGTGTFSQPAPQLSGIAAGSTGSDHCNLAAGAEIMSV